MNQVTNNQRKLALSDNYLSSLNSASIPTPSYILGPSKQSSTINNWSRLSYRIGPHFTNVASFIHRRAGRISRSPSPEKNTNFMENSMHQNEICENELLKNTKSLIGPVYLPSKLHIEGTKRIDTTRSVSLDIKTVKYLGEQIFCNEDILYEENRNLKKQISELKELVLIKEEENQKLKLKLEFIQKGIIGSTFGEKGSLPPLKVKPRNTSKSIIKEYKDDSIILYLCGNCNGENDGEFKKKKCLWKPNENIAKSLLREWKISYLCVQGKRTNKTMVNQDDFCIVRLSNDNFLMGVFDGHGRYGHKIAAIVRQKIMRGLQNIILERSPIYGNEMVENSIFFKDENFRPIEKVNRKRNLVNEISNLFDNTQLWLEKEDSFEVSGTSATIALIQNNRIVMIQLGSSGGRIINLSNGKVLYKTPQHDLNNAQERMRILNKGAIIDENNRFSFNKKEESCKNSHFSMTRSLGDNGGRVLGISHKPEIWEMKVEKGDPLIVILATDGYLKHCERIDVNYDKLYIQEELNSAVEKCQNIWMKTTNNMSVDDITLIACRISI